MAVSVRWTTRTIKRRAQQSTTRRRLVASDSECRCGRHATIMWNVIHATSLSPATTGAGDARVVGADRTLAMLAAPATYSHGVSLEEITSAVGSPQPAVHRAFGALRRAGAFFATGTPPGGGISLDPQVWLAPGDVMELGVDGLSTQHQTVVGPR